MHGIIEEKLRILVVTNDWERSFFMLSKKDKAVLDETYRTVCEGKDTIHMLLGKVEDDELALDLNRQACRFTQMEERLQKEYRQEGEKPPEDHAAAKARLWGAIQASTLLNASTGHLANMVMRENKDGIVRLLKTVKSNRGAARAYCEIAEEIMDFEEKSIEKLKVYL